MSAHLSASPAEADRSGASQAEFGRSAEGLLVARVGDAAFAMMPTRNGRFYLATGWQADRPMAQWRRTDFFGHSDELADEAAFYRAVAESAEHQFEKNALNRREVRSSISTPWGASQGAVTYGDGVIAHSTAGHGGFHLSEERNNMVHPLLRAHGGWYEEDAGWASIAVTFPNLFTRQERKAADRTVRDSWPGAWEVIFGRVLGPGESWEKDRQAFAQAHASDWVVISAILSDRVEGFTEVVATRGGKRDPQAEEQRFLVPSSEYKVGRFGFVIDQPCHQPYDGPSNFIGWLR